MRKEVPEDFEFETSMRTLSTLSTLPSLCFHASRKNAVLTNAVVKDCNAPTDAISTGAEYKS